MSKVQVAVCAFAFAVGVAAAQTTPSQSGGTGSAPGPADQVHTKTQFAPGVQLRLELDRTIDAKKAKVGDPVEAKMMDELMAGDQVVAPRGAKVIGHLAEATAHDKDTPSTLGIVFDKMVMPNNTEVPLSGSIQAIGKPETSNFGQNQNAMGGPGSNPPMAGGPGSRMGGTPQGGIGNPPSGAPGNPRGNGNGPTDGIPDTVNGQLTPNSQGVIGMSGVTLSAGSSGDSVLTSQKHNVKLDSGTQIVVRTR